MLIPMYLMLVLTLFIGTYTVLGRIRSVSKGEVKIKTYRTMDYDAMPEKLAVAGRCFNNQFEVPTLFYAVGVLSLAMNLVTPILVGLAWVFVVSRFIHAYVHLTSNNVLHRMLVYIIGVLIVFAMWTYVLLNLA